MIRILLTLALALALSPAVRAEVLTLEDCLRETAARNPTIIAAEQQIESATGNRLTLRARALPTLGIGGTVGYQGAQTEQQLQQRVRRPDGTTTKVTTTSQRAAQEIIIGTENLEQPLFDAAIPASWRRGDSGVLALQQNYYTIAVAQLYQARTLFCRALYLQERSALLRQTDEILATNTRTVEGLVNAGLKGRQELLASQVRRANFDPNILDAAGSYRTTLAQLLQYMGRQTGTGAGGSDPLTGITLRGKLDEAPISFDAAAIAKEALARRPDILFLRETARSDREDANIVRGGYYPRIRLYIAGELLPQSFVRSNRPNAIRATDQVQTTEIRPGAREDWNVIDTGAVRGEARRIDASREEIEVNIQRLERNIPGELAGVRALLEGSAGDLAALRGNVEVAQNTLNIINAGVAQGLNSQLEFLDAQTGVLSTQLGILDAKFALSIARAEFDRIAGRYLRFVIENPPATATRSHR